MSAVEQIQSAIDKLTKLRGNDEPWVLLGGNEWINPIGVTVAPDDGGVSPRQADLIVTLHATIGAQLEVLRDELQRLSRACSCDSKPWPPAIQLARAINGVTS